MSASPQLAFVTLVTSDSYLPGALVVAAALQDVHSSPPIYPDEYDPSEYDRVCLVTPETLDVNTIKQLRKAFDVVVGVEVIEEDTEEGLKLLGRLDLRTVLTKLHVFRLTSYRKIIFLDADVLPLQPISHLFRISASLAAVPDVGWPDIFNSGFFVLEPSEAKFKEIMEVVKSKGSWDGGDQGVLNEWAGQDWERLSFTYNTTPTAVYTYAPAYKRFGSQISNVHFIGPNKPWLQIPIRPPGASSSVSPPTSLPSQEFKPPPSYGYPALLDRWFAVYDKHYRPTPTTSQDVPTQSDESLRSLTGTPKVQRYINVWDSDVQPNEADTFHVGAPLGLEELRRLAVEGVGKSETGDGEGTYRSLPLEGRIDLMRPQPVKPDSENTQHRGVKLLLPEEPQAPVGSSRLEELRHLAVEGVGRSETGDGDGEGTYRSLPLNDRIDFTRPQPVRPDSGNGRPPAVKLLLPEEPHTPVRSSSPMTTLPTPGPHELPPTPVFRGQSLPPETPTHARPNAEALSFVSPDRDHLRPQRRRPSLTSSPLSRPTSPGHPVDPPRHRSPPLLIWDPAVEAPPNAPPPTSHFPEDTYFPNVWDAQSHVQPPPEDNGGLFPVPPVASIPEVLIKEGHYQAVIGESKHEEPRLPPHQDEHRHDQLPPEVHPTNQPSHPQPDRSKVVVVFPWEEKPRHAPIRFFPPTDSPPPGLAFIQPQSPALKLNLRPSPSHARSSLSLPRQQGFPQTATYTNAWDSVPSIQRYASRLMGPAHPPPAAWTPDTRPTRKGSGDDYQRWQDLVEVSSRDADDEDEDDDEGGEAGLGRSQTPAGQSRSIKKTYKGRSVQTVEREMRSRSVQFSGEDRKQVTRFAYTSRQERINLTTEVTGLGAKTSDVSSTIPEHSPALPRPSTTSIEISKVGKDIISPSFPPEDAPVGTHSGSTPVSRPAGRIFDPARGVDVFKKGSEEVLARFLKISSWDEDKTTSTNPPLTI